MLINIEQIKIEDRIRKDFGNIQELADDIKQNGLINPPVVMQESDNTYTLLAGERRIRALKLLGYKQVEVRTWKSLNDEEKLNIEISENEARKDFSKSERMEYALRLAKIEGLKAEERMKSGKEAPTEIFPQGKQGEVRDIVASKLGIGSGKQFDKEKYIYENQSTLPPEDFADWDEGRLSTNKAYQQIKAKLQQQEERLNSFQSQAAETEILKEKIRVLQSSIKEMEQRKTEVQTITKEVIPDDYNSLKSDNKCLKTDNARISREYTAKCKELEELKSKLKAIEEVSAEEQFSKKLKDDTIFFCGRVADFLQKNGGYVWITEHLNELPEHERKSYIAAIDNIGAWYQSLRDSIVTYNNI